MAQIKIFGHRDFLSSNRQALSDVIHESAAAAFGLPEDKRFHRFVGLDAEDFIYPDGRSEHYVIVELSMFEGRSVNAKKAFYAELYRKWAEVLHEDVADLEIVIAESPRHNWGIRGVPGDELTLSYKVEA
jgi:phenylpyruvate tautomerase PptA (4-oxalocrotonate tautomerase family)